MAFAIHPTTARSPRTCLPYKVNVIGGARLWHVTHRLVLWLGYQSLSMQQEISSTARHIRSWRSTNSHVSLRTGPRTLAVLRRYAYASQRRPKLVASCPKRKTKVSTPPGLCHTLMNSFTLCSSLAHNHHHEYHRSPSVGDFAKCFLHLLPSVALDATATTMARNPESAAPLPLSWELLH